MSQGTPTGDMIDRSAQVIFERCGEEGSTFSWARRIAELALVAAQTSPTPPMTDWQSIETVPRDEPVLLWDGRDISAGLVRDFGGRPNFYGLINGHAAFEDTQEYAAQVHVEATHWQPLPEPPK